MSRADPRAIAIRRSTRPSPAAYEKSLGEIAAKLNAEDQRRLKIALPTLALGNTVQSNALQFASLRRSIIL